MDTQQILSTLASLRDNLSAIETARQQVQNNVAAYDKVRQQLADTSTNITKILEDFTSLIKEIDAYQASISSDVETATKGILKQLKSKADSISAESTNVVDALKVTLASVQSELRVATDNAIQRIDENTIKTDENLEALFQQTNMRFVTSTEAVIKSFTQEIEAFKKHVSSLSESFDKSLSAQLGRLSTSVNDHIGKYETLNQNLKNQIDHLKNQNELFKGTVVSLEDSISKKIVELLPALKPLIDGLATEVVNAKGEIKSDIDSAYQKVKADLKGSHDATKKRIEKLEDKVVSNQTKITSSLESMSNALQGQIDYVKSQNSSIRTLTIVGFVILALPILLIFARIFKFI